MDSIDKLGTAASQTAMKAAAEYLRKHNLGADVDALCECIRAHMRAALPGALNDAKAALDANMGAVAERTFLASMALAGIEAAKEAGFPKSA